jgi:LPXTG-site transpeptidase (sortase) family protein
MRRRLQESAGWCYDFLWYLVDLRYQQPKLLLGIVAALVALVTLISIATLGVGGGAPQVSQSPWSERSATATAESDRPVRYVPYNGLAQSQSQKAVVLEESSADRNGPGVVLQRLSDVLRDQYDESDLTFGSDGAEGAILPLDNGVVPSSGPRFSTHWELILPSAGIRAAVVQVGLTHDGAMGSPDNPFVVGWFNRSAVPGELGNALLGGHRDYQDLNGNVDVGVCWELDETRVGDQLIMFEHSSNRYYVYDIVDTVTIRPDSQEAIKYLSQTRESVVTLITCAGDFDEDTHSYSERIVVVALLNAVAAPDA